MERINEVVALHGLEAGPAVAREEGQELKREAKRRSIGKGNKPC